MSYLPPSESNPFQAPQARIGQMVTGFDETDQGEAELIRRDHIGHEASIKSLGTLYYLGAFFALLATIVMVGIAIVGPPVNPQNNQNLPPETMRLFMIAGAVFYLFATLLNGALGFGLRRLQVWSRWTVLVLTVLGLLYVLVVGVVVAFANPVMGLVVIGGGSLIPGYILYLMVSPKSGMVFSAPYKLVIQKTPHVKAKTSLLAKIVLVLIIAVVVFIIVMATMAPRG